jgi:hypothetical protein
MHFIFQNLHSMESHVDNHLVKKHSITRLSNLTSGQSKAKFLKKRLIRISPNSIKFNLTLKDTWSITNFIKSIFPNLELSNTFANMRRSTYCLFT